MTYDIQKVKIAREMRLFGKSLSEINRELHIPKSTLSNWLKDITLNEEQKAFLKERVKNMVSRGRLNSSISIRTKRVFKEKKIFEEAEKEFTHLQKDSFFTLGLALYWAKGSKKGSHIQFSNSNPSMIDIMSKWMMKYLKIDENSLKMRNYDGYLRVDVMNIDALRKVVAWQKLLIKYYDDIGEV